MSRLAISRPRAIAKEAPVKYTRKLLVSGNRANAFSAASAMQKVIEITLRVAFGIITSDSCEALAACQQDGYQSGTARQGRAMPSPRNGDIHTSYSRPLDFAGRG